MLGLKSAFCDLKNLPRSLSKHENFNIMSTFRVKLDGSLPANAVNDQCVANAVTYKSTFRLP